MIEQEYLCIHFVFLGKLTPTKEKHVDEKHVKKAERLKNNLSVHHTKKKKHKEKDKHEHRSSHKEKHQSKHHNHLKSKDASEKNSQKHKEHNSLSKNLPIASYVNAEKLSEPTITTTKNKTLLNESASSETDSSIISQCHDSTHVQNITSPNEKLHNLCTIQQSTVSCNVTKTEDISDDSLSSLIKHKIVESGIKRKFSDFVNTENSNTCKKVKIEISDSDSLHIKKETEPSILNVNISDSDNTILKSANSCYSSEMIDISEKQKCNQEFSSENMNSVLSENDLVSVENKNEKNCHSLQISELEESKELDCDNLPFHNKSDLTSLNKACSKQFSESTIAESIYNEKEELHKGNCNKGDLSHHSSNKSDFRAFNHNVQNADPQKSVVASPAVSSAIIKKETESEKHSKPDHRTLSVKNEFSSSPSKVKIHTEKSKSDKSKHDSKNFTNTKPKYLKPSNVDKSEKEKHLEKKSKHHKEGKSSKSSSTSNSIQNKKVSSAPKDSKEKVLHKDKSHSSLKTELCLRCRQKLTSHRNVSIQCKRDRHDKILEKIGVSQRIPRLPQGLDMRHLKYGKYIRLEVYPNGGAALLHLYWDEISHLHQKELRALAEEFLKVSFFFFLRLIYRLFLKI